MCLFMTPVFLIVHFKGVFTFWLSCRLGILFIPGKVFVTYEADSEKHIKEVINFVALLRHNGFYTHVRELRKQFLKRLRIIRE